MSPFDWILSKFCSSFIQLEELLSSNFLRSVVAPEHVKGYIYVEAFKQTHVKAAIDGISNLRMGSWSQQMVPIKEMTDVLRVVKEAAGLKVKQWVRIKRGVFKDDLAQVDYVDVASNQVKPLSWKDPFPFWL